MDEMNMSIPSQQGNSFYQPVQIKPDSKEKRDIRRMYTRTAIIILLNIFIFNIVMKGAMYLVCGIIKGDTSSLSAMQAAANEIIGKSEFIGTIFSVGVPIISEVTAVIVGLKLCKVKLRHLFTVDGFGGSDVAKGLSVSLGLQTLAALIVLIVNALYALLGFEAYTPPLTANTNAWSNVILYTYACIIGPILEEILYRGVILQSIRKYNERFAIIVSSLIFGLMHQNYQQFILAFMIGLIFSAVTLKYNSIIPSIIMHIIVNSSGVLMSLLINYVAPQAFTDVMSGNMNFDTSDGMFMGIIAVNAIIRYGFLFAAIIILIISMIKGGNIKKPTLAGKKRGWPILLTSVAWYVVFALYFYLCFIDPVYRIEK